MAEDSEDPREVEWHPRKATKLLGHVAAEQRMRQAFESGKLHHAWLISGPKGIGKATLAYRFAGFALAGGNLTSDDLGIDSNWRWTMPDCSRISSASRQEAAAGAWPSSMRRTT